MLAYARVVGGKNTNNGTKHGKFLSGHGHEMNIPGNLGSGHTSHIPFNQVNPDYFKIPAGVQYSIPPGF